MSHSNRTKVQDTKINVSVQEIISIALLSVLCIRQNVGVLLVCLYRLHLSIKATCFIQVSERESVGGGSEGDHSLSTMNN